MIIELVNGIKIYADGVEIAPDGTITAYDGEGEAEEEATSLERGLNKSVAYHKLSGKHRATFDVIQENGGEVSTSYVSDTMGITISAASSRLAILQEAGLINRVRRGLWVVA